MMESTKGYSFDFPPGYLIGVYVVGICHLPSPRIYQLGY